MVSGVTLHSLPSGYRFDLRKRKLMAPLRPVSATDRELASLQAATNRTRRLIRSIAAEGADDTAPERARRAGAPRAASRRGGQRVTATGARARASGARGRRAAGLEAAAGAEDRRDARLPRAELLELRAGHQARRRPRRARALPDEHDPRLHRGAARDAARRRPAHVRHGHASAASPIGCARARGSGTSPSTSRSSSSARRAPRSAAARPAAPASRAGTTSSTRTPRRASGVAAGKLAVRLVNHLVEAEPTFDFGAELERLILLAERAAFGPSTQAHPRRGGAARHPVDPPQRAVARPARPRRPPEADPGHDDEPDRVARRRHRLGQEAHEPAAGRDRRAGPRARRSSATRTARWPPRGASATRWRSSRSTATTGAA